MLMNLGVPEQHHDIILDSAYEIIDKNVISDVLPFEVFREALPNLRYLEEYQQVAAGILPKNHPHFPEQVVSIGSYYMNRGDISGQWKITIGEKVSRLKAIAVSQGFLFELEQSEIEQVKRSATEAEMIGVASVLSEFAQMNLERPIRATGSVLGGIINRVLGRVH